MSALTRAAGALAGWKGYAAAALAGGLALGAAAWTAQSWRYGERLAVQHAAQADEVAEGQRQAREILAQRHAAVAEINERNQRAEWAAYGGMRNAQIQDDGLRADVDAGRQRLHVRAVCTGAGRGMSDASTAAGVDHGAGAELDPFARSDYFALRAGIQRVTVQLQACQAMLGAGALAAATGQWPASGLMTAGAAGTNALGRAVMRPSRVERLSRSTTLSGPASLGGLQAPFPK